jgi:arginine decarboxylase
VLGTPCHTLPIPRTARLIPGAVEAPTKRPKPPGIPTLVPGERINQAVVDSLHSGLRAGMVIPDVTDTTLETIVVVA